jgi:hypothetical protein
MYWRIRTHRTPGILYRESCAPELLIEHLLATGDALRSTDLERLSFPGLFTPADARRLVSVIADVDIYRRATLPLRCHPCGGDDFDPVATMCRRGTELDFMAVDSITAVVRRANASEDTRRVGLLRRLFG